VELLTVIAIIAVLAAILLPGLRRAKQRALAVACMSNLRQTGIGIFQYTEEYGEFPSNETQAISWWYYRYRTRGANGVMWVRQVAGSQGWQDPVYRCPARLPGNNEIVGNTPWNGENWCWGARTHRQHAEELWDANQVRNGDRGWYYYQGPLHYYEEWVGSTQYIACTDWDVQANAWDCWGDAWRSNNSLSRRDPIQNRATNQNSPVFRRTGGARVIAYCPNASRVPGPGGGSPWWHQWTAPHMDQRAIGEGVSVEAAVDSRNYLFNDGRVVFLNR
jgi:type II secretory pathway pseudopilin PulG